jgi:hypothetical protein
MAVNDAAARSQAVALALTRLWWEAGTVIALRLWGWCPSGEHQRMIDEKAPAYARAALEAWQASMVAATRAPFDPTRVVFAGTDTWIRSLSRKTRANRRRLSRRRRR